MGKLNKYSAESKLMNVSIHYGEENFNFNLFKELVIDENKINQEIKEQPSAYAFLNMLYKKLLRKAKDLEKEMEKTYWSSFLTYKEQIDPNTNRPVSNDVAEAKVKISRKYIDKLEAYLDAEHDANILEACVKSFEQRAQLIQTLSANLRNKN